MYHPENRRYIPGELITFEGGEGAGKTSVIQAVAEWMRSLNMPCILTREPGGTNPGHEIRKILLSQHMKLAPKTELLLFMADRCEHLARTIRPALQGGGLVLCDRYIDSTIAYQCHGRGLDYWEVRRLHAFIGAIEPTLTFWLDVDPEVGLERTSRARELDRIEGDAELQSSLRAGFRRLTATSPHRIVRIDANRPLGSVTRDVIHILRDHLAGRSGNLASDQLWKEAVEAWKFETQLIADLMERL